MAADVDWPAGWPVPDEDALATSRRLVSRLVEAIRDAGGALAFSRFMEMALYEPGLGYYSAGARKLGAAGDFVTAPEISPVFARCLAHQCAEVLAALEGGDILEPGAGSGAMAAELLTELERCARLPARYAILEVSADLRARQRETLRQRCGHLLDRVVWLDEPPRESWRGMVVANEVVDALAAARFETAADGLREVAVGEKGGVLVSATMAASEPVRDAVARIESELGAPFAPGYRGEVRPSVPGWLSAITTNLVRGIVLLVDYGLPRRELYLSERADGTLMCHYRHRAHGDALFAPGLQDITAWVDFTALAEAATAQGFQVCGYTTQAHFLIGCGLDQRIAQCLDDGADPVEISGGVRKLTLPGEMGERFKVMALARDVDTPLRGFSVRDLAARL